jgi:phosphatidate phosphatase APP1
MRNRHEAQHTPSRRVKRNAANMHAGGRSRRGLLWEKTLSKVNDIMTDKLPACVAGWLLLCGASMATLAQDHTMLKGDEHVQFFRTAAHRVDGTHWQVPIHAWVYEPERSSARRGAVAAVLKRKYDLFVEAATESNFNRRVNLLLADNERGKPLVIRLNGEVHEVSGKTDPRGHLRATLKIPVDSLPTATDKVAVVPVELLLGEGDTRIFTGEVLLVPERGISLISDIDDTVKISEVLDKKRLMDRTFYQNFAAVEGMADLYRQLEARGIPLHFVSSSPWHLYAPLAEFFETSGFPAFTVSLKTIRLKDSSILDLFKGGDVTKPRQIEPLLESFPERRFLLVGDSGEQDPEVYRAMMRKYPQQIIATYIRNVSGATVDDSRFGPLVAEFGAERFVLFAEPVEVAARLQRLGVL